MNSGSKSRQPQPLLTPNCGLQTKHTEHTRRLLHKPRCLYGTATSVQRTAICRLFHTVCRASSVKEQYLECVVTFGFELCRQSSLALLDGVSPMICQWGAAILINSSWECEPKRGARKLCCVYCKLRLCVTLKIAAAPARLGRSHANRRLPTNLPTDSVLYSRRAESRTLQEDSRWSRGVFSLVFDGSHLFKPRLFP